MASTKLTRTPSGASNKKTFTWSGWVKRSGLGAIQGLFTVDTGSGESAFGFLADDTLRLYLNIASNYPTIVTNQVFRDTSAWYHIAFAVDTTQSTEADRVKIYVNGSQVTSFSSASYPTQNADTDFNTTNLHEIGFYSNQNSGGYFDGQLAHVHFTDGYAYAASSFGSTATNGQWVPNLNPSVTYGTNGYFLKFTNASDLGEDFSGNNNDYTKSGSGDKVLDNPENVFATLNPSDNYWANSTFSEGNCKMVTAASGYGYPRSTIGLSTGKWYFEAKASDLSGNLFVGIVSTANNGTEQEVGYHANDYGYKFTSGAIRTAGSETSYGNSISTSDILGVAIDLDNNKLYFSKNGTFQNSADPVSGSNGFSITAPSSTVVGEYFPTASDINSNNSSTLQLNFGNPSFTIASGNADGNGEGNFEYAPPTGYLAICTNNVSSELTLPIGKGGSYMNTVLYTGNGSNQSITGLGFQPDMVWLKSRVNNEGHWLGDSNRGVNLRLVPNNESAEFDTGPSGNNYPGVSSYDSDGFGLGRSDAANHNGQSMVSWSWRASGSTATNNNGTVTTTVSANTTSGFSIVKFTSPSAGSYTLGHGLSSAPELVIYKCRGTTSPWWTFFSLVDGSLDYMDLASTAASANDSAGLAVPTTTVFSLVNNYAPTNQTSIAYCFHSVEGYSKIGKYTGNGSTDGPFAYTGFKPAWVMIKRLNNGTNGWTIYDSVRNPSNVVEKQLMANSDGAEEADAAHNAARDFLSNGFKIKETGNDVNVSGSDYLYMAFAENPFVDSSGVPTTAR